MRLHEKLRLNVFLPLAGVLTLLFVTMQNCADVKLSRVADPVVAINVVPNLFGPLQPVLAVRNAGCIMCHAQIDGDLITDVGNGDPFVMGTDALKFHENQAQTYGPFGSKHFLYEGNAWNTASVMGNIYVPNLTITNQTLIGAWTNPVAGNTSTGAPLTLQTFLTTPYVDSVYAPGVASKVIPTSKSTDITVPGLRGNVLSRQAIWIDAPTSAEILSLQNLDGAVQYQTKLGVSIFKSSQADQLAGLNAVQSQNTFKLIITNTDTVVTCTGDIIIDGTLFLNNLNLATDANGCRLYVTGSVFIQGPITYTNGANSNLQISSSRAIVMGMRALSSRLTQNFSPAMVGGMRSAPTDDAEIAENAAIATDRDSVDDLTNDAGPFQLMVDTQGNVIGIQDDYDIGTFSVVPGGPNPVPDPETCSINSLPLGTATCAVDFVLSFPNAASYRKSINYTHLLLNAPKVYSRYTGSFQGVIIAEDALFAANHFKFSKDPVLLQTTLLPLMQNRIFHMTDY